MVYRATTRNYYWSHPETSSPVFETLSGRPPLGRVEVQQDEDEVLGVLRHQPETGVVHVHVAGQDVLLKLHGVPAI